MAGGLLNIISVGNNNVILTGNPTKTFFKVAYSKYTNFGLQKFRIDYDGMRDLRLSEPSTFTFRIPRHAELLMDTYIAVTLPDIWSPIYDLYDASGSGLDTGRETIHITEPSVTWASYDFRWIRDLGTHMIKEVTITCGSLMLQKYSGEYLAAMVDRDFTREKKELFNRMSGNVAELNDPANAHGRSNTYPSAYTTASTGGAEPSIRGREIYIPINAWFTLDSRCAFPLISLQYNELNINVTMRPIQDLFQVRDVFDVDNKYPYVRPDFTKPQFQMYRYLQTPPSTNLNSVNYENKTLTWNADIHLITTYCFLSKDEAKLFAAKEQLYLVKDVFEYNFENISGTKKVEMKSSGMISSWMWYLQRNDANMRNEWSNYTNWPYHNIPYNVQLAPATNGYGPGVKPRTDDGIVRTGLYITGDFHAENQKDILVTMGILLNGEYRENILTRGIYDYIEKYTRTNGGAKEGLYCYNFCLNTNPLEYQPSGAINLSKFKNIDLEVTTYIPTIDLVNNNYQILCGADGNPIGVQKNNWRLYEYTYNMKLFEERYNILSFIGGNCGMLYAR